MVVGSPELGRERAQPSAAVLAALADAATAVVAAPPTPAAVRPLAVALAAAVPADVVVVRALEPDGDCLSVCAVAARSAAVAAELEGARIPTAAVDPQRQTDQAAELAEPIRATAARLGVDATLVTPIVAGARVIGAIELYRDAPFDDDAKFAARLAAAHAALALERALVPENGADRAPAAERALELTGDALAAAAAIGRTADEVVRLAAEAAGARAAILWRRDGEEGPLRAVAAHGERALADGVAASELAEHALAAVGPVALASNGRPARAVVTLQLGQPPAGALQLFLDAEPSEETLAQLGTFAVRAAHALRASERTAQLGLELDRTRALLGVVAQANAQLSLSHALDTAVGRVAELLGAERVAVYLRADARLVPAAERALSGPHAAVAERLLELALGPFRGRGMLVVDDAAGDARLAGLEDEVAETGIEAAVAAPLFVPNDVIGLLAVYLPRGRSLSEHEWALLAALAAQLAVTVQNARLHERATQLGSELQSVLSLERHAARRLAALYEISRSFAQSLSLETTLDAVARTVAELLDVDAALIRMPDVRRDALTARALHVVDERLDEAIRALLLRPQPLAKLPGRRLFRMGRALVLDARTARRLSGYELLVPFLRKGSTAVVVPIATSSELLGTLTLLSLDAERPITEETTEIALSVAAQAALAIDNARLYQQQKEFVDTMARSLLPRSSPELPGLEIGDVYASSARVDVGGDVYDFMVLDDGRLAVVLGDVTGHGIDAAADMAMAKFVFRSLAREHPEPDDFLAAANDVVCGEIASGKFITMLYLAIDAADGTIVCAGAGHPPPRLVLPDGTVTPLEVRGLALGIDPRQTYVPLRETLVPGASVVLYTDGLVEARRGAELYGHARLDEMLSTRRELPAQELARAAIADCRAFSGGELGDDCAIVVIKRTP